jgi:hypothetical protein
MREMRAIPGAILTSVDGPNKRVPYGHWRSAVRAARRLAAQTGHAFAVIDPFHVKRDEFYGPKGGK